LGDLIFRGVAMVNTSLILKGAVPAALLALIADVLLTFVERSLVKNAFSPPGGEKVREARMRGPY
jgi:osmoprotectant transport system permease protein